MVDRIDIAAFKEWPPPAAMLGFVFTGHPGAEGPILRGRCVDARHCDRRSGHRVQRPAQRSPGMGHSARTLSLVGNGEAS